jgi:ferredoxin--NADP+ reductase
MNTLSSGDKILDLVGPLGNPTVVQRYGTVAIIGGGVGAAFAYPIAVAMKEAGNKVISIIGASTHTSVILEEKIGAVSDEVFITTEDGSYGEKGTVIDRLRALVEGGRQLDLVYAIGPAPMMRAVAQTTRNRSIKTIVSLNSIMVDGTGMCGGCRVIVDGEIRFACIDGPEFDAYRVEFKTLQLRNQMYLAPERKALELFQQAPEKDLRLLAGQCKLEEKFPEMFLPRPTGGEERNGAASAGWEDELQDEPT